MLGWIRNGCRVFYMAIVLLPCAQADITPHPVVFPSLQYYEWPESSIAKLSEQANEVARVHTVRPEMDTLQLVHLYWILGRYDEALSLVSSLRFQAGTSADTVKTAEVLYMLVTASSQVSKGKVTDAVISVAGGEQTAVEIRTKGIREEVVAASKRERFRFLALTIPRIAQFDQDLKDGDGEAFSREAIELMLGLLRPATLHDIKMKEAATSFQRSVPVPDVELKWLTSNQPWAAAALRAMEQLDSELFDLDLAVVGHSVAEVRRKQRRAQIFAARGSTRQALIESQTAAADFRLLARDDDLMDALDTVTEILVSVDTPDTLLRALFSSQALIDLHERRMSRLGPDLGRYQVRYGNVYRRHRELIKKLWLMKNEGKVPHSLDIERTLVLQTDLARLRSARRQIAMYRALSQNPSQSKLARTRFDKALDDLKLAKDRLSVAKGKREAPGDHRTGEVARMVEMLEKTERDDDVVVLEFDPPGKGMSVSMETGPYASLGDVKRRTREDMEAIGARSIGESGKSTELPSSWQALISGMGEKDGILTYLEFGLDEPLVAAVIYHNGQVRLVKLPSVTLKDVQSLMVEAMTELRKPVAGYEPMKRLAHILWEPLDTLPERLTIVPNLSLVGLPFEALPIAEGKYVNDNYIIRYALGLADGIGATGESPPLQSAAVLGAYEFRKVGRYLPESKLEVLGIRSALTQGSVTVTPKEAFPRRGKLWLTNSQEKVGVLHVSTHMIPDEAEPMFDVLEFPDDEISAFEMALSPVKADLSILSACNLLGNREKGTNPVSGLSTAALANIGPKVVGSLWPVESRETRMFMQVFYDVLQETKGPERALTNTKRMFQHTNLLREWLSKQNGKVGELGALDAYTPSSYWASFALIVAP